MRRKVQLADGVKRVVFFDDEATIGATLGRNLYAEDGTTLLDRVTLKGDKGDSGIGAGVMSGGTAGQVLVKASGTDFDTAWHSLAKADVGLGSVDNTSDATKPVSAAQAAADAAVQAFAIQRGNHTGSQLASTISNFAATVIATVLTGLSLASSAAVTAADSILVAIGKLQAQVTLRRPLTLVTTQVASYTLVAADADTHVRMNAAGANALTIPPNATVPFRIGTEVWVEQAGAGVTTITAGAGVTLRTTVGVTPSAQYGVMGWRKVAIDTWSAISKT